MNRLVAAVLAVAVPATALADGPSLVPSYEQPLAEKLVTAAPQPAAEVPLYKRWYTWVAVGGTATAAAVVIGVVAAMSKSSAPLRKSDVGCGAAGACDGWINPPAQ